MTTIIYTSQEDKDTFFELIIDAKKNKSVLLIFVRNHIDRAFDISLTLLNEAGNDKRTIIEEQLPILQEYVKSYIYVRNGIENERFWVRLGEKPH
jgi:hypothetical protein